MLYLDPTSAASTALPNMTAVVDAGRGRIEKADGSDTSESMPMTLLYVLVDVDGSLSGPGYMQLGDHLGRCRPVSELRTRALSDLTAASG